MLRLRRGEVCPGVAWRGVAWVGLGWVGLGWVGLGWGGVGWVGVGLIYLNFRRKVAKVRTNGLLEHEASQLADVVAKTIRPKASWRGVRRRHGVGAGWGRWVVSIRSGGWASGRAY